MPGSKSKPLGNTVVGPLARRPISSRTGHVENALLDGDNATISGKRKADASPQRHERIKRQALGNLTNAASIVNVVDEKKPRNKDDNTQALRTKTTIKKVAPPPPPPAVPLHTHGVQQRATKVLTRAASRATKPSLAKGKAVDDKSAVTVVVPKLKADEFVTTAIKPKRKSDTGSNDASQPDEVKAPTRRISLEIDQIEGDENSLYVSASEEL